MTRKKNKFDFQKIAMKAVGVGGGAVVGGFANKFLGNLNPMLRGGIKMAVGAVIPEFIPMKDKTLVENIGSGIIASGAIDIATSAGIVPAEVQGIGDDGEDTFDQFDEDSFVTDDEMYGLDEDSPIFGDEDSPISGDDEIEIE